MDASSPQPPGSTANAEPGSRLEPGTVIACRWTITRRLGAMRLDETYEAKDASTAETVALRVIRRDDGGDDSTFRRFARVARRLSTIRHPNVQRILGFATHETRRGQARERIALLVTEVLNGETLTHRVRRTGPFRGEAADALLRDLCRGLDAIHRARAIHGDITGASVLLVAGDDGSARAVLTDLAFLSSGEGDEQAIARAVGSPAYRAPEQLTGGKIHRATDIFSLGAVIYEAMTGRLPFTGGNLLALDFRQLEEQPRRPREFAPDIEPSLERVILRCLERSPSSRFERAPELLLAMRGENVSTPRFRQAARTLGAASLLIALMLGGSALLSWVSVVEDRRLGVELARRSRPSIAVMPLRADRVAEDDAWIVVAATELLRLELLRDDALRVASRELVEDARRDLVLADSETLAPPALLYVRTMIDAEQVLVGSCRVAGTADGVEVTLDLCVQNTRTGETTGSVLESGTLAELPQLVARAVVRLRPVAGAPATERTARRETWSPAGLEAWARGLASLDEKRTEKAISALRLAATTDAQNPAVRLALSQAFWASGDVARATDEAKRAWDASEGLSRERVLQLELRHAELRNEPARLIEAYRRMIRTYPDNVDQGFGLVGTLIRAGNIEDATRALRSLQSATSTTLDPRLALLKARIDAMEGRHADAIASASDAAMIAATIGARKLEAEAEVEKALAAGASGDARTARASLGKAIESFRSRGDLDEVARMTAMTAALDRREGKSEAALDSLREAERIYRAIGQRQGIAATEGSIAVLLASRGRHREAVRGFATALDGFVAIGDRENATRTRIGLAEALYSLGALAAAESQLRSVIAANAAEGDTLHRGLALLELARIETARGRVARSREHLEQAAGAFDSQRFADGAREVEILRAIDAWLMDDEAAARRTLESVRTVARRAGSETAACRAALPLARIALRGGDADMALRAATDCVELLTVRGSPADATTARAVAAIAALRLGDRAHASALVDSLEKALPSEEDLAARTIGTIAKESLRGGRPSVAFRLAADAAESSMTLVELDALMTAAEFASHSGDRRTAADALARVERIARKNNLPVYLRLVDAARENSAK